jgi:phage terminase small subunit
MAKLTEKQQRFVAEYLIDLNATQAAIRTGYSARTAEQIGYQLLQKTSVQQEIAQQMAERSKRTGISQDRVVLELAKIALVNIGNLIDPDDGSILPTATEEDMACVESVKVKQIPTKSGDMGIEREVKIASKLKALELLGKHLGMWSDKVEVTGNSTHVDIYMPAKESVEDE